MLALERLSPLERSAFLLHDVFGESFEDIAAALGRDAAACRQLASRARDIVRTERPRFTIDRQHGMELAAAFFQASHGEGITKFSALLASGVRDRKSTRLKSRHSCASRMPLSACQKQNTDTNEK